MGRTASATAVWVAGLRTVIVAASAADLEVTAVDPPAPAAAAARRALAVPEEAAEATAVAGAEAVAAVVAVVAAVGVVAAEAAVGDDGQLLPAARLTTVLLGDNNVYSICRHTRRRVSADRIMLYS